jgi:hypothetical protein
MFSYLVYMSAIIFMNFFNTTITVLYSYNFGCGAVWVQYLVPDIKRGT